jgi:molybdenum cofactor biosynthesis enzyme MoaA
MIAMKRKKSMVIDLTYICNFTCHYCQWGDPTNEKRKNIRPDKLLVKSKSLKQMDIERIVFSGGEPLLHPNFREIVRYYGKSVNEVVMITNGLLLDDKRLDDYCDQGLTGVTFSLDSTDEQICKDTRDISKKTLAKVLRNIHLVVNSKRDGKLREVGMNVVVSSANCNLVDIQRTMDFAFSEGLDFVKFNAIFDDGYVTKNSPQLKLSAIHANEIRKIGNWISESTTLNTNTAEFWFTLASLTEGQTLVGGTCGIDDYQSISMDGEIKFCFWVDDPVYGQVDEVLTANSIENSVSQFMMRKKKCVTGNHCFCLQDMEHIWEIA